MSVLTRIFAAAATLALSAGIAAADVPVLRLATQVAGTVNWEIDTIVHNGYDSANGFRLAVQDVAGSPAAQVAFQGGEADIIVSDWLWVARQRAEGKDYVFIPYSRAVGAVMVRSDSPLTDLSGLAGGRIGVAGGPLDKSWLILRAYARQVHDLDLAAETEQVFAAPPLIFKAALSGETDAAINFWHFNAKAEAAGMRPLLTVSDAALALGLDPETPLLGYVVRGEMLRENPGLVRGFAAASRAAKALLTTDEAAWDRLRPIMNAADDTEFAALRDGFRAGIPAPGPVDEAAAARMLALMAELGGTELMGPASALPEGVFVQPGS